MNRQSKCKNANPVIPTDRNIDKQAKCHCQIDTFFFLIGSDVQKASMLPGESKYLHYGFLPLTATYKDGFSSPPGLSYVNQ